jgi:hypothetical protein
MEARNTLEPPESGQTFSSDQFDHEAAPGFGPTPASDATQASAAIHALKAERMAVAR